MDHAHLWLFFGLVFSVVILPGMGMAFVLGSALVGGHRAGLAAVLGLDVFTLAVFPQFIRPERPIAGQALVLGAIAARC